MSLQPHEITLELIYGIQALAIANSYIVVPAVGFTRSQLEIYWEDVAHAGLLDHRFPEDVARDFDEFLDGRMIKPHSYYVVNCDHVEIRAEFELDNFTGKAAQIHFSMHPANTASLNAALADQVGDQILFNWKSVTDLSAAFLDTLYGLTPVANRAACLFVLRAGMERIGTLPSGSLYFGNIVDTMLTTRTRN